MVTACWSINPYVCGQATQQGGVVVFDGQRCVLEHKDRATGAHIDLRALLAAATPLAKQNRAT